MKLYCLSGHTNRPCYVLKFKKTTIMLDCSLDMMQSLVFLPLPLIHSSRLCGLPSWTPRSSSDPQLEGELKECSGRVLIDSSPEFCPPEEGIIDFADIDVILISNYHTMLALPYVTENSGFKGVVYATEPTMQIGRQLMEELITYIERTPKIRLASRWKLPNILKTLPPPLCDSIRPRLWKQIYSLKEMNNSLSKVQAVGFCEKLDVYGAVEISAISSSFAIGSCNWNIQSAHEKVSYIAASSMISTHTKPFDGDGISNSDVVVISGLSQAPLANPDSMMGEICVTVSMTIRNGGNVLIPCYPCGVTLDLIECLASQIENAGHINVPMYFISPVADHSLAYSNILADWLSITKQSKVYIPEEPFYYSALIRSGRLKAFSSIKDDNFSSEFRTPCIVFAGHPSLRFGDCVHFMELWGNSPNNSVIFIEPDFPYAEAIAPYQPLALKVVHYPIDTSLSYNQANKVIRESGCRYVVVPEQYTVPSPLHKHRSDLAIEAECNTISLKRGAVVQIPVYRRYERIDMDSEFADSLTPTEVKSGVCIKTVTGQLNVKNNKYELKCVKKESPDQSPAKKKPKIGEPNFPTCYPWGALDVPSFIQKLNKIGIAEVKVEKSPLGFIVELQNEDILIRVEEHSTHIICAGDSEVRPKLNSLLLECLNRF